MVNVTIYIAYMDPMGNRINQFYGLELVDPINTNYWGWWILLRDVVFGDKKVKDSAII